MTTQTLAIRPIGSRYATEGVAHLRDNRRGLIIDRCTGIVEFSGSEVAVPDDWDDGAERELAIEFNHNTCRHSLEFVAPRKFSLSVELPVTRASGGVWRKDGDHLHRVQ